MSRALDVYIYQLLEPESVIITGNARRHKPIKPLKQSPIKTALDEGEKRQREYLKLNAK